MDATIRFHKSRMLLHLHSDGSYLSAPKYFSRAGGHFYLSNNAIDPLTGPHNGPVYVPAKIQKNVLRLAAEAEIGATYVHTREAINISNMLIGMGHPQTQTPTQVDNNTSVGFLNGTINIFFRNQPTCVRYYWVQDRTEQWQFYIHWSLGRGNIGNYHTKYFSPDHHKQVQGVYLHKPTKIMIPGSARV